MIKFQKQFSIQGALRSLLNFSGQIDLEVHSGYGENITFLMKMEEDGKPATRKIASGRGMIFRKPHMSSIVQQADDVSQT